MKTCPDCDEKTTKRPIDSSTGQFAKTTDSETWGTFDEASEFARETDAHGVGFVFSEDDQIAGVDLDDCRDPDTGEVDDWALRVIRKLASFAEVSPSGTGAHVYAYDEVPEGGSRKGDIEMYGSGRYFTVTGEALPQAPGSVDYRQDELEQVHEGHIDVDDRASADVDVSIDPLGSEDVLDFSNDLGESLAEIRDRDQKLDHLLSSIEAGYESASEADMATASKLWFWRFNPQQIADIIRTHRRRPKVIDRDYLELTISRAVGGEQYQESEPVSAVDLKRLAALHPDDRRQFAERQGIEWPSTAEARTRPCARMLAAFENGEEVVIDAPTALGKSHTIATEPWLDHGDVVTGNQPVVHAHETKESRDQAFETSEAAPGVDAVRLQGRDGLCPLAQGLHDPHGDAHDDRGGHDGHEGNGGHEELHCDDCGLTSVVSARRRRQAPTTVGDGKCVHCASPGVSALGPRIVYVREGFGPSIN